VALEIVDLDKLVGAPRVVKLGGAQYKLPNDCPAELYLLLLRVAQAGEDEQETELVETLMDAMLELFQVHQPDMQQLPAAMSIKLLVTLVGHVYSEGEAPADPTPAPKTRSTRNTRRPSASRSPK